MFKKIITAAAVILAAASSVQAASPKEVLREALDMAEYALWDATNICYSDTIMPFEHQFTYTLAEDAHVNYLWDENPQTGVKFTAGDFVAFHMIGQDIWDGTFCLHMETPDGSLVHDNDYDVTFQSAMYGDIECIHSADMVFRTPLSFADGVILVKFNVDTELRELYPCTRHRVVECNYPVDESVVNERLIDILYALAQESHQIYYDPNSNDGLYIWTMENLISGFQYFFDQLHPNAPHLTFDYLSEITYEEPAIEEPAIEEPTQEEPAIEEPQQEEPQGKGRILTGPSDSEETGISQISTDGPVRIYDLSGRAVVNPTHGIYIVNGKKVRL